MNEDPRPGQRVKLDEKAKAHLIALACSAAPEGHDHWRLRLLADKLVELGIVKSLSYETVRQMLKKQTEALAKEDVVYPHGGVRVRGLYGRCAGLVRRTL